MNILQIFFEWFWVVPAFLIGLAALGLVYDWFEPWIKGKTRDELKQIARQNSIEYQKREQKKKEQALHQTLLGLNDRDFDKFFSEVCSASEGECRKHTGGLGSTETLSIYGEVRNFREAKQKK